MQSTSATFDTDIIASVRKIRQRTVIDFVATETVSPVVTADEGDSTACPKANLIDGREDVWGTANTPNMYAFPDYYNEEDGALFVDGFETGDMSLWDSIHDFTAQDSVKYAGTYAASGGPTAGYCSMDFGDYDINRISGVFYWRIASWSTVITESPILLIRSTAPIHYGGINVDSVNYQLYAQMSSPNSTEVHSDPIDVVLNTWYKISFILDWSNPTHKLTWMVDDVEQSPVIFPVDCTDTITVDSFTLENEADSTSYFDGVTINGHAMAFPSDHLYPVPSNVLYEGDNISTATADIDDGVLQYPFSDDWLTTENIICDYGGDITVSKVTWKAERNSRCYPIMFSVYYWDGASYQVITDVATVIINETGDIQWEYTVDPAVITQKLKMEVYSIGSPKNTVRISEFGGGWPKDMSDRVISWEIIKERTTESEQSSPLGNSSSNALTLELDNHDGVFNRGSGSVYAPYLRANRPITVSAGLLLSDGTTELLPQGTFYTVAWDSDQDSPSVRVTAWDKSKLLKEKTFSSSTVYEGYTISELVELLCADYGMGVGEYDVDVTTETIDYAWFDKKSYWEHLVDLAIAEGGAVYFNEENVLIFESRTHLSTGSAVATLTDANTVISMSEGWEQQRMRNKVEVRANPLTLGAETEIYNNTEVITVPGSGTKTVKVFYSKVPSLNVHNPVITGGADISIDSWTAYAWGGTLVLANSDAGDETVTQITIDGDPLESLGGFVATAEDTDLEAENGVRSFEINSKLIQSLAHAQAIADDLLTYIGDPGSERVVQARGRPELQLADLIHVENSRMDVDGDQWIQRVIMTYDGGLTMEMTILEASRVASPSPSPSASASASPSKSPSASPSASPSKSPSASPSASISPSTSESASLSLSPSASESVSPSASTSASPSTSVSPSSSISASPSSSVSASPSASPSKSPSASPSASTSTSPSSSESASPSSTVTEITASTATNYRIRGLDATYNTAHTTSSAVSNLGKFGQQYAGSVYYCDRLYFKFDTSSIPDTDNVTDVKMRLVCTEDNSVTNFDVQICEQNWSSQDPISDANRETAFDNCLAEGDYVVWRNTNGIVINTQYTGPSMTNAYVNKTGATYYSIRASDDYSGTPPTDDSYIYLGLPDNATEAYRPVLIITHGT